MKTKTETSETDDDFEVEAAWAAEIERRIAEVESGVEAVRWEEVRARVRTKLSKTSQ